MPNGATTDQWFLEVNGKKFGPYTMAQIESLVRHHEIMGEDKITAPHLEGKWISVQEFVKRPPPAAVAASTPVVPPRPDEKTLTSLIAPSKQTAVRTPSSDTVLNLFEILQAARERKPAHSSVAGVAVIPEMPVPVARTSGAGLFFWIGIPASVVAAVVTWKVSTSSAPVATSEAEPAIAKREPSRPIAAPVHAPAAPAAQAASIPAAKPKTVTSIQSGFNPGRALIRPSTGSGPSATSAATDRERELEREREREREAEREHERERERDSQYVQAAPEQHRDKERERERELERGDRATASAGTSNFPVDATAFGQNGDREAFMREERPNAPSTQSP